jgi:hypothetical protein
MDDPSGTGITLLLGPVNAGKMGLVLEWWQQRLGQRPIVVMPTSAGAQELTVEMATRGGGLVGQSPAVTFDGLVRSVLGRSPRFVSDFEQIMIASRALRGARAEELARARHLPGTAGSVARFVAELNESGRSLEDMDGILARWAASDPAAAPLAGDVRRLVTAYTEICGRLGWTDRATVLREAVRVMEGWTRPVAFYGFTSFTPGQRNLIEALSGHAPVLMTFTHDRGRGTGLCTPEEVAWWEERAGEVIEVAARAEAYSSPAIAYLERFFMTDEPSLERVSPTATSGDGGVRFLLGSGKRAEAELAAQQISALLRAGRRPGEIGVIVRQTAVWKALLDEVFVSCGIPYQMDDRCLLGETGLGHAFLNVLRGVALDDWKSLLSYLRSPYSGVSPDDASDLERRYLRGVARGAQVLAEMARRGCGDVLRPLWQLLATDSREAGSNEQDYAAARPSLVVAEAESVAASMLRAGVRGAAAGRREFEEDARAYGALKAALSSIAAIVAADGAGPVDAWAALALIAQVTVPGRRADTKDAVHVLSVQRARARRFEVVFVLGLVEGEFPGRCDPPSLLSAPPPAPRSGGGGGGVGAHPDPHEGG